MNGYAIIIIMSGAIVWYYSSDSEWIQPVDIWIALGLLGALGLSIVMDWLWNARAK